MSDKFITSVWLPEPMRTKLADEAWRSRVTRSELIRVALQKLLDEIDERSRDAAKAAKMSKKEGKG
jgi:Arc/MetJ-type ribon-helix-helix transcriptional regulator